jgi:hypothetical protein
MPMRPFVLLAAGCLAAGAAQSTRHEVPPAINADSAEVQLRRFLDLAVASRKPVIGMWTPVFTCNDPDHEDRVRALWIADSKILSIRPKGDSMKAVVLLTSVVDEADHGFFGWQKILRVQDDTAHFTLARDSADGGTWKVCGEALEHFGIRILGSDATWFPKGASQAAAIATTDSIRKARGLSIVR